MDSKGKNYGNPITDRILEPPDRTCHPQFLTPSRLPKSCPEEGEGGKESGSAGIKGLPPSNLSIRKRRPDKSSPKPKRYAF
jgi:hypothetical protein